MAWGMIRNDAGRAAPRSRSTASSPEFTCGGFMMKLFVSLVLVGAIGAMAASAQETARKEVTLKGKILCVHCELKEGTKCQTAIEVKEGDKTTVYFFSDKGSAESYHEPVCGGGRKDGAVTGTTEEKEGKKWVAPKKVDYAK
jgi:Family of unknown function (DUF6370)